jgi:hypothetical protein
MPDSNPESFPFEPNDLSKYEAEFTSLESARYQEQVTDFRLKVAVFLAAHGALYENEGFAVFSSVRSETAGSLMDVDNEPLFKTVWIEQARSLIEEGITGEHTKHFPVIRIVVNEMFRMPDGTGSHIFASDFILDHQQDISLFFGCAKFTVDPKPDIEPTGTCPLIMNHTKNGQKIIFNVHGIDRREGINEPDIPEIIFSDFVTGDMQYGLDFAKQIVDSVRDVEPEYVFRLEE